MSCLHVDDLFNDSYQHSFNWKCCVQLHDMLDHVIGNSFVYDKLDYSPNFLLNLWNWHVNDSLHCAILHALLNSLLRYTRNRLVRVSTIRSGTRSCGITLMFCWVCQRSVSLRIVNVHPFDHVLRFCIRELLTHVFFFTWR